MMKKAKLWLARPMNRFVLWQQLRLRKKCIKRLRGHFAFFGYDTSGMTDDEIEACVTLAGKKIAKMGVSLQQATHGFEAIARAARE